MARMDLSDNRIFGDDIDHWDSAPASKTEPALKAEPVSKTEPNSETEITSKTEKSAKSPGQPKRKRIDAQDRVVLIQAILAVMVILLFLAVKFVFPKLHETLSKQYAEFNAKPPIFDLDDIKRLVTPAAAFTITDPRAFGAPTNRAPTGQETGNTYVKI